MKGKELKRIANQIKDDGEVVLKCEGEEVFIWCNTSDFLGTKLEIDMKPKSERKAVVVEGVK